MPNVPPPRRGRGAQINVANPYDQLRYDELPDPEDALRTEYIPTHPTTILNKITSPDLGNGYGLNSYQGCEHGCVYCSHHPYLLGLQRGTGL